LHGLFVVRGREHEQVDALAAGDIGGVAKLAGTATGDTLAARGPTVRVAPIEVPDALLGRGCRARHAGRRRQARHGPPPLQEEDPALRVERDEETHQTLLWGVGDTHSRWRSSGSSGSSA